MLKTLSIVIPVYNEEKRLSITFSEFRDSLSFGGFKLKEIIFVNDGSIDSTLRILKENKASLEKSTKAKIKIISYKGNRGKGYALKKGMLVSTSAFTLLSDADISTPLNEVRKFEIFVDHGAQVVIGTRKNGHSTVKVAQPLYRQALGHVFTILSQVILNTWVSDFTCGFKLFSLEAKNEIFSRSKIEGWGYDSEILFLAKKLGFEINEKAVTWRNKKGSRVNVVKDGVVSLVELLKIRSFDFAGIYGKKNVQVRYA